MIQLWDANVDDREKPTTVTSFDIPDVVASIYVKYFHFCWSQSYQTPPKGQERTYLSSSHLIQAKANLCYLRVHYSKQRMYQ